MQSPFFVCKKLGNSEFCAILVHFFRHKKVSQVYFTITYETISAERQGFEPWDPQRRSTVFETAPIDHSGTSPFRQH